MPDIDKINNVAVADISKLDSITFADGQKVNNQDVSLVTDAHVLIATDTSDGSDTSLGFTSGIDSTYDVYEFVLTNIHPETADQDFEFQVSTGSGFDQLNITSTFFYAYHQENGASANVSYVDNEDQAQGTSYQHLVPHQGGAAEESLSGVLTLYAPSDTTYVKHFMARFIGNLLGTYSIDNYIAGYINTTSAIDEIDFKFASGEIQGGEIKMYGLAKS